MRAPLSPGSRADRRSASTPRAGLGRAPCSGPRVCFARDATLKEKVKNQRGKREANCLQRGKDAAANNHEAKYHDATRHAALPDTVVCAHTPAGGTQPPSPGHETQLFTTGPCRERSGRATQDTAEYHNSLDKNVQGRDLHGDDRGGANKCLFPDPKTRAENFQLAGETYLSVPAFAEPLLNIVKGSEAKRYHTRVILLPILSDWLTHLL